MVAKHEVTPSRVTIASESEFSFSSPVTDCPLLNKAFERYSWEFLFHDVPVQPDPAYNVLTEVVVEIPNGAANLCTEFPNLDKNPAYEACKTMHTNPLTYDYFH